MSRIYYLRSRSSLGRSAGLETLEVDLFVAICSMSIKKVSENVVKSGSGHALMFKEGVNGVNRLATKGEKYY